MTDRKVLCSIIFLLLIFGISFRFLFFMSYVQLQKTEFRKALLKSPANIINVNISKHQLYSDNDNFEWKENNQELVISGVYHEVLAVTVFKDSATVTLIEDKTENILFQNFFTQSNKEQTSHQNILVQLLTLQFYSEENLIPLINNFSAITANFHEVNCCLPSTFPQGLFRPPISC